MSHGQTARCVPAAAALPAATSACPAAPGCLVELRLSRSLVILLPDHAQGTAFGAACAKCKLQAVGQCKGDLRSMGHAERFFGPGQLPPELSVGFCVDTRGQAFVGGLATTLMYGIEMERGRRPANYVRKAVSIFAGGCMRRGKRLARWCLLPSQACLEPASGGSSIIVPVAGHSVEYGTVCTSAQLPNKQAFRSPQHALSTHPAPAHAVAHPPAGGNYANAMQPGLLEEQLGQGTCVIEGGRCAWRSGCPASAGYGRHDRLCGKG